MDQNEKPTMRNAGNEKQVQRGKDRDRRLREREISDLRHVLASVQGRRLVWRILKECKTFESVWRPSAEIHYLSGKQDLGHFLMGEVLKAGEETLLQMMKESKEYTDV